MRGWPTGILCGLLFPAMLEAQTVAPPGRFEFAAGGLWAAPVSAGAADATETAPDGTRFRLFASESSTASTIGLEGRVGVRLTPVLQLDGSVSYAAPELRTRITSDVEGIPDVTVSETSNQWTIEGALVAHLVRWRVGPRGVPFLAIGAGYLRQIHEGQTLVEPGRIYQVGGGVKFLLKRSGDGRLKSAGLRLGARAAVRTGGGRLETGIRIAPLVDVSLFLRY